MPSTCRIIMQHLAH